MNFFSFFHAKKKKEEIIIFLSGLKTKYGEIYLHRRDKNTFYQEVVFFFFYFYYLYLSLVVGTSIKPPSGCKII
jgi:hypothetical protein